jgi:sensor domain CHASE-containing protein
VIQQTAAHPQQQQIQVQQGPPWIQAIVSSGNAITQGIAFLSGLVSLVCGGVAPLPCGPLWYGI